MIQTFYCRENKDAAKAFIAALVSAGYLQVESPAEADFLLMDHDYQKESYARWQTYFTKEAQAQRPLFIYPHVPYSWFLWDNITRATGAACNFVVSEGAREGMCLYGYPYRIEVVGFAGVAVKPFTPTQGTRLLFAPAHPIHNGKYPQPEGLRYARAATRQIMQYFDCFESVTVRYSHTLEQCGLEAFRRLKSEPRLHLEPVDIYTLPNIREHALAAIDKADLIISNSTFGYLSVASGKPTVFYGYKDMIPFSREGYVKQYRKWKHIFYYPLVLEEMNGDQVLAVRMEQNEAAENWKRLNIGDNFCAEKFVSVVESCL